MASASSVTFHAWAWPRRPIIEGGSTTDPGTVEGEEEEGGWAEEEAGKPNNAGIRILAKPHSVIFQIIDKIKITTRVLFLHNLF